MPVSAARTRLPTLRQLEGGVPRLGLAGSRRCQLERTTLLARRVAAASRRPREERSASLLGIRTSRSHWPSMPRGCAPRTRVGGDRASRRPRNGWPRCGGVLARGAGMRTHLLPTARRCPMRTTRRTRCARKGTTVSRCPRQMKTIKIHHHRVLGPLRIRPTTACRPSVGHGHAQLRRSGGYERAGHGDGAWGLVPQNRGGSSLQAGEATAAVQKAASLTACQSRTASPCDTTSAMQPTAAETAASQVAWHNVDVSRAAERPHFGG